MKWRGERAQRTTPSEHHFVQVDDARTFMVAGAFTESMIALAADQAPAPVVRADLTGKWNHGAVDVPVLMMAPATARSWAHHMLLCADAAERDVVTYLAGRYPDTGKKRP